MDSKEKGYLLEVKLLREKVPSFDEYPFSLPVLRNLETFPLHPRVTFLVGENGSGKSTLLEAIAKELKLNPEGGNKNINFSTVQTHSNLNEYIRLIKSSKIPKDSFFLRAESFYNVSSYIDEMAWGLESYGGKAMHQQSHGESFISLLNHKFKGNGIYLLDEPESALSPSRQLSTLAIIHKLVCNNSQFIIATHSPILMAYPNAKIYSFSEDGIVNISYKETDHYLISKDFLNNPETGLRYLLED